MKKSDVHVFVFLLDFVGKAESLKFEWLLTPWSKCSQTCGGGLQTRKAHCVDLSGRVIGEHHCLAEAKLVRQNCHMESCPRWEVGDWTPVKTQFLLLTILLLFEILELQFHCMRS